MNFLPTLLGLLPRRLLKGVARLQWRNPMFKAAFDRIRRSVVEQEGPIRQGAGKGLLFSADGSNAGYLLGTSEPHVQRALELLIKPGMTVYDIGANIGFFSVIAARLTGPAGRVIAFDPLEQNTKRIRHNSELNAMQITVRQLAVGAEDGTATFVVSEVSSWGRLKSAGESARKQGEMDVPVRRLDSLVREGTVPPPDLLKIDVEGAEEFVLRGAAGTIQLLKPVLLIELHGTNEAVLNALEEMAYEAVAIGQGEKSALEAPWNAHLVAFDRNSESVEPAVQFALRSPDILS